MKMKNDTLESLAAEEDAANTAYEAVIEATCEVVIEAACVICAAAVEPAFAARNTKLRDIALRRDALHRDALRAALETK